MADETQLSKGRVLKSRPSIPGYEIERTLGQGGTACVYEAVQAKTGRKLALKILTLRHAQDLGAALARLKREAHIGRSMDHPDIVSVLDYGQAGQTAWIAMDLLDGFELTHALTDPSFGLMDRFNVVLRVAAALQYAHGLGIVHRDIKPSNIFMTRDGGVRLLDFGIAHIKVDLRLTQTGVIVGTPRYMAPEQVMGQDIDARTDVFSLGIVLYQALCGAMPWKGETVARLIIEVATKPAISLLDVLQDNRLGLSQVALNELSEVVHRAIAFEPENRFQTMQAFSDALESFVGGTTGAPSTPVANTWTHRKVDWALARAARLQADQSLGTPTPADRRGPDALDQTLSDKPDPVWAFLLVLFVIGLGAAAYFVWS